MQIGHLSRQMATLYGSSGGFTSDRVDNPKKESCKAVETSFEVVTNKGVNEIVEEELMEKKEMRSEKHESKNQDDQAERGVTIEQLIDKNSH